MTNPLALWDIDNCLADDQWRHHLIDWDKTGNERYDEYNRLMLQDPVAHASEFHFMCRFTRPIFFTGRTSKWCKETVQWLEKFLGVVNPVLYMRHMDEQGSPAAVKFRMLRELKTSPIFGPRPIVAAFDDVPAVIDMYKRAGIAACRLHIYEDLSAVYSKSDLQPLAL